jgi:putative glutamine amidotransferase
MPNLATWMQEKDEKWFRPFLANHPAVHVYNARKNAVSMDQIMALLTGGSDISPEFLRQEVVDPSVLDKGIDAARDRWEFAAVQEALTRGLPILGICKGIQVLNVALGGTLRLDIAGHKLPEQKEQDIQPLRYDVTAKHRFEKVNSSHHQAVDRVADGFEVEAWCHSTILSSKCGCAITPSRLPFRYHPSAEIYDDLFEDFFSRLIIVER